MTEINADPLQFLENLECLELHGIEMFFSVRAYYRIEWGSMGFESLMKTLDLKKLKTLKLVNITYSEEHKVKLQDAAKNKNITLIVESEIIDSGKS